MTSRLSWGNSTRHRIYLSELRKAPRFFALFINQSSSRSQYESTWDIRHERSFVKSIVGELFVHTYIHTYSPISTTPALYCTSIPKWPSLSCFPVSDFFFVRSDSYMCSTYIHTCILAATFPYLIDDTFSTHRFISKHINGFFNFF